MDEPHGSSTLPDGYSSPAPASIFESRFMGTGHIVQSDSTQTYTIGELAQQCDVHLETLRYNERMDLMQPPPRSSSVHRQYPA